ncbi:hypothetical protein F511_33387 [Dorcoceras hygrometricum]|uniref:Uncharacterized protein n=1 Tax=Dorcoceras hygrometricum TaxID=472368 RepID=A0A2Z7CFA3_9LAMI|nr:hypothetical protein F511_33387 [Dorcoceras hygrometricum]
MRERACMAAPDRRSTCAPVPHERRMIAAPSREDVATLAGGCPCKMLRTLANDGRRLV